MRRSLVFILAFTLEIACATVYPRADGKAAPTSTAVLDTVRKAVSQKWKGAQLADSGIASSCAAGDAKSPPFLSGDFNGDGADDLALVVNTPEGTRLVAAFFQTSDYALVDVAPAVDLSQARGGVRKRGDLFHQRDFNMDNYFGVDTITLAPCSGAPTAYYWTGDQFVGQELAD